jgi:hypothetical protein
MFNGDVFRCKWQMPWAVSSLLAARVDPNQTRFDFAAFIYSDLYQSIYSISIKIMHFYLAT